VAFRLADRTDEVLAAAVPDFAAPFAVRQRGFVSKPVRWPSQAVEERELPQIDGLGRPSYMTETEF
jgi:hypothetical protein